MSGFNAPNYTQIPNGFFSMMSDMSEAELKVVLCALAHNQEVGLIGHRTIEQVTGLSQSAVISGLEAAIRRGVMRIASTDERGVNLYQIITTLENGEGGQS